MSPHQRLAILLFAWPVLAIAQVYKSVGPDGKVMYSDAPPPSTSKSEVRPEIKARSSRPEDDPVTASMIIYANQTLVETFYRFCAKEVPESEPALRQARDKWNSQHAALSEKKIKIVHERFTVEELRKLAASMEREHLDILKKVRAAPAAEKSKWCNDGPSKFSSEQMSPARNPTLVKTVMDYKLKVR